MVLFLSLAQGVLIGDETELARVEDNLAGLEVARGEDAEAMDWRRLDDYVTEIAFSRSHHAPGNGFPLIGAGTPLLGRDSRSRPAPRQIPFAKKRESAIERGRRSE